MKLTLVFANDSTVEVERDFMTSISVVVKSMLEDNPEVSSIPLPLIPSISRFNDLLKPGRMSIERLIGKANDADYLHCDEQLKDAIRHLARQMSSCNEYVVTKLIKGLVPEVLTQVLKQVDGSKIVCEVMRGVPTFPWPWHIDYVARNCGQCEFDKYETSPITQLCALRFFESVKVERTSSCSADALICIVRDRDLDEIRRIRPTDMCCVRWAAPQLKAVAICAAFFGDLDILKMVWSEDVVDIHGFMWLLQVSCSEGHIHIVDFLLDNNPHVRHANEIVSAVLKFSFSYQRLTLFNHIIDRAPPTDLLALQSDILHYLVTERGFQIEMSLDVLRRRLVQAIQEHSLNGCKLIFSLGEISLSDTDRSTVVHHLHKSSEEVRQYVADKLNLTDLKPPKKLRDVFSGIQTVFGKVISYA